MSAIKILEQVSFMSEVYFCYPEHTFVLQSNNKGRGGGGRPALVLSELTLSND